MCSDNLKNILDNKHKVFRREKDKQMNELEYFISCKIFIELLEPVNYLHAQTPPIIHRDIKPDNILFTDNGIQTGIYFKLCDFGLAKLYDGTSNTKGRGTDKYMAPEVKSGKQYNTKADVYSLSIIAEELFVLDNESQKTESLESYFEIIEKLVDDMRKMAKNRPTCREVLDEHDKWLPKMTSYDFSPNDLPECNSLNIYTEYHVNLCK